MRNNGQYGVRVTRPFKADKKYVAEAIVDAEIVMTWPIANRQALARAGKIEFLPPTADQVPAPTRSRGGKKQKPEVSDTAQLLAQALEAGVVTKKGGWHSFGDVKMGNGIKKATSFLNKSPEAVEKIKTLLNEGG